MPLSILFTEHWRLKALRLWRMDQETKCTGLSPYLIFQLACWRQWCTLGIVFNVCTFNVNRHTWHTQSTSEPSYCVQVKLVLVPFVHWSYGPGNHTQGPFRRFQGVHSSDYKKWHNTGLSSNQSARIHFMWKRRQATYSDLLSLSASYYTNTCNRMNPWKALASLELACSVSVSLPYRRVFLQRRCSVQWHTPCCLAKPRCLASATQSALWHVGLQDPTEIWAMYDDSINLSIQYTND